MDLRQVNPYLIAGGILAAAGLWIVLRGPGNVGRSLGASAVDVVNGILVGAGEAIYQTGAAAVKTTQEAVYPKAAKDKCALARQEGGVFNVLTSCEPSSFLQWGWE